VNVIINIFIVLQVPVLHLTSLLIQY